MKQWGLFVKVIGTLAWNEKRWYHWRKVKLLSRVQLFVTPWTHVAYQAPQSMGFSRQEYWSGLPFPSPTLKRQAAMEELLCLAKKLQTFASCPKNRPFTLCHLLPHSCVERGWLNLNRIWTTRKPQWKIAQWTSKCLHLKDWDQFFTLFFLISFTFSFF